MNKSTKPKKRTPKRGNAAASIAAVANYMHGTVARHCANCGRPMTPSDVNDYGSLCESCYMQEYYG